VTGVLTLASANAVSVLLLGTLCVLRLSGRLGIAAFLGCLVIVFILATVLWVWTERRHRQLPLLRRAARVIVALLVVVILAPMAVLTPLFWLDAQLPPQAEFHRPLGFVMAGMLMALVLAVLVNAVGAVVIALRGLTGRGHAAPSASAG
jgi:ABC-type amino acid transport system permease subunit